MARNDDLKKVLAELGEQLKKRVEDKDEQCRLINLKRDDIDGVRCLAEEISESYKRRISELEGRLAAKDRIPEIVSEIESLKNSINNAGSGNLSGVEEKIDSIRRRIDGIGRDFRRVKIIDSIRYSAAMWIGGVAIAAASIFAGYKIYRPINTKDVPVNDNPIRYIENFSDILRNSIPSFESFAKLEDVLINSEGGRNSATAKLEESNRNRRELFRAVNNSEYNIDSEQALVTMVNTTRVNLERANSELSRANELLRDAPELKEKFDALKRANDELYQGLTRVTGKSITENNQILTLMRESIRDSKSVYAYIERSNLGTVSTPAEVQQVLENLLSSRVSLERNLRALYAALTPIGVTDGLPSQEVQRILQSKISERVNNENRLQGQIQVMGTERDNIRREKEGLESKLTQILGNPWEAEYREYLENPQDHTFKSIEVLKKHSERAGVVAILEDKIKISDELRQKLITDFGWDVSRTYNPIDIYVQNGDFVTFDSMTGLLVNNVLTLSGTLNNLLGIPNNTDMMLSIQVKRDKNNIYLCSYDKTIARFSRPADSDKIFDSFDASFLGTSSNGSRTVLGVEDGGPFVYIVDGPSPADVKKINCHGLWAPWRNNVDGILTREFYPSTSDTDTVLLTNKKRGSAMLIDLRASQITSPEPIETVHRFNDAWMSIALEGRYRYTNLWEKKGTKEAPASILKVKSETSPKSSDALDMNYSTIDYLTFTMFPTTSISPYISIGAPLSETRLKVGSNNIAPEQYRHDDDIKAFPLSGGLKLFGAKGEVYPYGRFYWGLNYRLERLVQLRIRDDKGVQVASGSGYIHGVDLELGFLVDDGLNPKNPYNTGRFKIFVGGGWNMGRLEFEEGTNKRTSNNILTPIDTSAGNIDVEGINFQAGIQIEW